MRKALINGRVFDGDVLHRGMAVLLQDGRIAGLLPDHEIPATVEVLYDLEGHILAPGLIDMQVNGGGGVMFNNAPSVETIRRMASAHRRFGTTGFLPTLISSDFDTMKHAIEAVELAISDGVQGVLGIHLEGPFLNIEKRGIHDADKFCELDEAAFHLVTSLKEGCTLLTIAPELTSSDMISRLTEQGVLVFGGHSAATFEQTMTALRSGLRGFTHLFNAMSPFESRAPGMVGAALSDMESWFGIIADGQHVHPATFAIAVAAKRKGRSVLVTDAMASVGSSQKTFELDGVEIETIDGCCRTPEGDLAGSGLDMITAVRNAAHFAGLNPSEALRMASTYPAHALDLDYQLGYIRPGYKANFVEVDENLNLYSTWVDGEIND